MRKRTGLADDHVVQKLRQRLAKRSALETFHARLWSRHACSYSRAEPQLFFANAQFQSMKCFLYVSNIKVLTMDWLKPSSNFLTSDLTLSLAGPLTILGARLCLIPGWPALGLSHCFHKFVLYDRPLKGQLAFRCFLFFAVSNSVPSLLSSSGLQIFRILGNIFHSSSSSA